MATVGEPNGSGGEAGRSPPIPLRMASVLLLLLLVTGAVGIVLLARHILTASHVEPSRDLIFDVALLVERSLQWVTAAVALRAIRHRRVLGRWLTCGLMLYVAVKLIWGFRGAVYAALGQADTTSRLPFTSPAEGLGGIVFASAMVIALVALASSMTFSKAVRGYFTP